MSEEAVPVGATDSDELVVVTDGHESVGDVKAVSIHSAVILDTPVSPVVLIICSGAEAGVKRERSDDFHATRMSDRSATSGLLLMVVTVVVPTIVWYVSSPEAVSVIKIATVGVTKELKHAISPSVPQNPL